MSKFIYCIIVCNNKTCNKILICIHKTYLRNLFSWKDIEELLFLEKNTNGYKICVTCKNYGKNRKKFCVCMKARQNIIVYGEEK